MEGIYIPIDIYNELPFYVAMAARAAYVDGNIADAGQLWGTIGALARTCRAAAEAVGRSKAGLVEIGHCSNHTEKIIVRQHVDVYRTELPNGMLHGVQMEYWWPTRRQDDDKYIYLYKFGRCIRMIFIETQYDESIICIYDPDYLCTGETLEIRIDAHNTSRVDERWITVCPGNLEMFFYEFITHFDAEITGVGVSVSDSPPGFGQDTLEDILNAKPADVDSADADNPEEDRDSWARLYEAREFVHAWADLYRSCDCDDPHDCPYHTAISCDCGW